jgi:hypothetical protein
MRRLRHCSGWSLSLAVAMIVVSCARSMPAPPTTSEAEESATHNREPAPAAEVGSWASLRGQRLSSLAWSPNGRYIAFVATRIGRDGDEEMQGPDTGAIWRQDTVNDRNGAHLARLVACTRDEGIPVGLFWLSDTELGWGAAGGDSRFRAMRLTDTRPRDLLPFAAGSYQASSYGERSGPDDVGYDAQSDELSWVGAVTGVGEGCSRSVIWRYSLGGRQLATFPLAIALDCADTFYGGLDGKRGLYVAGLLTEERGRRSVILHSLSGTQVDEVVTAPTGSLGFPRLSPDGRALAWVQTWDQSGRTTSRVVVRSLPGDQPRPLCQLPAHWRGMTPGLGVPYCWSPDSHRIAFWDGLSVKTVVVHPGTDPSP